MRIPFSSLFPKTLAFLAVLFLSALFVAGPGRAETISPKILKSVVSLLPEWPSARRRPKEPEGTAVAILPGGYLATNDHVIGRAKKIRIRLHDGRVLPAEIIGRDILTDLALIKAPMDLPVLPLGVEPGLGDRVCAIGNQFGLGLSVTCGVASALHRTGTGFNQIEDFIQTDAVVNPGGSGGALIDSQGYLVGLVSAIFTKESDANIGVNFAASIKLVMRVVQDLKETGQVNRGNPGFRARDLTLEERRTAAGAAVNQMSQGDAAKDAGLKIGDIIVAIGDRKILRASDIPSAIHMVRPGQSLVVEFIRGGNHQTVTLVLAK